MAKCRRLIWRCWRVFLFAVKPLPEFSDWQGLLVTVLMGFLGAANLAKYANLLSGYLASWVPNIAVFLGLGVVLLFVAAYRLMGQVDAVEEARPILKLTARQERRAFSLKEYAIVTDDTIRKRIEATAGAPSLAYIEIANVSPSLNPRTDVRVLTAFLTYSDGDGKQLCERITGAWMDLGAAPTIDHFLPNLSPDPVLLVRGGQRTLAVAIKYPFQEVAYALNHESHLFDRAPSVNALHIGRGLGTADAFVKIELVGGDDAGGWVREVHYYRLCNRGPAQQLRLEQLSAPAWGALNQLP